MDFLGLQISWPLGDQCFSRLVAIFKIPHLWDVPSLLGLGVKQLTLSAVLLSRFHYLLVYLHV